MNHHKEENNRSWFIVLVLMLALLLILSLANRTSARSVAAEDAYKTYMPLATTMQAVGLEYVGTVTNPTDIVETPYGLLASEVAGRIINLTGNTVFLDITNRDESVGALSITFFEDYLYVLYVAFGQKNMQYISRFAINGSAADPNSEEIILSIPTIKGTNHLGGSIFFGPDGYFYYSTGDRTQKQGDPTGQAQDKTKLAGSILRMDLGGSGLAADCGGTGNYTIPADNPFVDGAGSNCDEIWANGLRQPWRVSVDRETGDLWISDVGYLQREEINFQPASSSGAENYGWNCYEGSLPFRADGCQETYVFPVYEYERTGIMCAIIGGYAYRGALFPALSGQYIFADYCSGEIYAFDRATSTEHALAWKENAQWTAFAESAAGELYVADYLGGHVYRIGLP